MSLDVTEDPLEAWAAAGVITPVDSAPGAAPLWDVEQLREQTQRLDEYGDP